MRRAWPARPDPLTPILKSRNDVLQCLPPQPDEVPDVANGGMRRRRFDCGRRAGACPDRAGPNDQVREPAVRRRLPPDGEIDGAEASKFGTFSL